jgi:hypothetical protein
VSCGQEFYTNHHWTRKKSIGQTIAAANRPSSSFPPTSGLVATCKEQAEGRLGRLVLSKAVHRVLGKRITGHCAFGVFHAPTRTITQSHWTGRSLTVSAKAAIF